MRLAALIMLLAPGPAVLLDEVFEIPASQWRIAPVTPKNAPAALQCDFRVVSGEAHVRVVVMDTEEFRQLKSGDRELLDSGEQAARGSLSRMVSAGEEFAVVMENTEARGPIRVALQVREQRLPVGQLSPQRRLGVIAISVTAFLAIVIFSGRKLLGVIR